MNFSDYLLNLVLLLLNYFNTNEIFFTFELFFGRTYVALDNKAEWKVKSLNEIFSKRQNATYQILHNIFGWNVFVGEHKKDSKHFLRACVCKVKE